MNDAQANPGRRSLHLRRITCEGFLRDDGLIDIDGMLLDTKPHSHRLVNKVVDAGEPIHLMHMRITINREREIVDAKAVTEQGPYDECLEVQPFYRKLIGLKLEAGFSRVVKKMFAGTQGCTHMTELLPPMATTAFQVLWSEDGWDGVDEPGSRARTSPINGCHALRIESHVVQTYFKEHLKNA
ncbi:MAG: DUF2889 domain-containing protein [Pseudomonadota bacterium]